jgi:hypothetical protein
MAKGRLGGKVTTFFAAFVSTGIMAGLALSTGFVFVK